MIVTLGNAIAAAQSSEVLAITNRAKIIQYILRALELAVYKADWNIWIGEIEVCCNADGWVYLPSFVGTPLSVNVSGFPAWQRDQWYKYHINGYGSRGCNAVCNWTWDQKGVYPTFQDIPSGYAWLGAICEDPIDGNGSLSLTVQGVTMDGLGNTKMALTIPQSGPSSPGVVVPLLYGAAATDPLMTPFKQITQVTKPVTRGYVKLIAFSSVQGANATVIGYYGPNETNPQYRRINAHACCKTVSIKYRRADYPTLSLVEDYDIVPIASQEALIRLIKAVRFADKNDIQSAAAYEASAVELLREVQAIEDGPGYAPMQVDPSLSPGTIDYR